MLEADEAKRECDDSHLAFVNKPPRLARHVLELAYGTTSLATQDARQKLDADEVITSSSPTATLLSLLRNNGI